jgi:hypothetical protein
VTADTPPAGPPAVSRNPITLAGVALTTAAAIAFLTYVVLEQLGLVENPYAGLFGYFLLPGVFVLGLLLIPVGMWREARRRRAGRGPWRWPLVDFDRRPTRRIAAAIAVLTLVNLGIVAIAGVGATHYMETTEFCGQVCHEPMQPQFAAHQVGAHASVNCASCHVRPGAAGALQAKLNGTRQLYEIARGSFPRPIRAEGRVPGASDTCMSCHRPWFAPRDSTKVIREYAEDEPNTETVTTLDVFGSKIHWHARPDVQIDYAVSPADPAVVTYVRAVQAATEYLGPGVTAAPASGLRRMDCLDCHSRPAHAFSATAERAVDQAIASGQISRALPFVRREAVAALRAEYDSEAVALAEIERRLKAFYAARGPALAPDVSRAVDATQRLYRTNVFPRMKVTWGTYLPQNSHVDAPGCFRCHDDEHKATSGKIISQDCELCHKVR